MKALTNNWLRAGITLMILVFGVFFIVKAMEKKEKPVPQTEVLNTGWFEFMGGSGDDPTDESQYRLLDPNEPLPNCPGGGEVCAINAPLDSSGQPIIDQDLEEEIELATQKKEKTTNVHVRQ
ncbi:hypothetical protein [Albibacterium indicum]|uniref:hypothetical protein n=1 Tax=Albibacterium indicum TaxID=2292082 RepID=UPI00130083BE|nr:hypothetical protein [Pedobacter indicus]